MPLEVLCSKCQGRLRVEKAGVVVACPLCGAHLMIPEPRPAVAAAAPVPPKPAPAPAPPKPAPMPAPAPVSSAPPEPFFGAGFIPDNVPASSDVPDFSHLANLNFDEAPPWMPPGARAESPPMTFPDFSQPAAAHSAAPGGAAVSGESKSGLAITAGASPATATPPASALPTPPPLLTPAAVTPPAVTATVETSPVVTSAAVTPSVEAPPAVTPAAVVEPQVPMVAPSPAVAPQPAAAPVSEVTGFPASEEPSASGGIVAENAPAAVAVIDVPAEGVFVPEPKPPAAPSIPEASVPVSTTPPAEVPMVSPAAHVAAVEAEPMPWMPPGSGIGHSSGGNVAVAESMPWQPPEESSVPAPAPAASVPAVASVPAIAAVPAAVVAAPAVVSAAPSVAAPVIASSAVAPASSPPMAAAATKSVSGKPTPRKATVPQLWFVLVLSYASAVTFLLIYLLTQSQYGKPSNLESLPDVVPELTPTGQVKQKFVDPRAPMPAGHTLALGESRRFGDLIVTPLRVVREPVEFTHFDDPKKTRPPGEAVLKLWVRLENASSSQAFPPLGKEIVFNRYRRPGEAFQELSNNFVASVANKAKGGPLVLIYPHVVQDVWDLRGQDVGHVLKPGESFETYLPSDTENLNSLSGELVWRIHFRKGLNAKSKRGVTTIVEVSFQGSDIQGGGSKG